MMNFWFDGDNFAAVAGENGFVLNRVGFLAPVRDVQEVTVPGRHGTLTIDNRRYNDTDGLYQCFIQSGYQDKVHDVIDWLDKPGYKRLEDTMDKSVYRMAKFTGLSEKKVKDNDIARFDVSFRFAPERWLKSGEEPVAFSASGVIYNPTRHDSTPKIVVHGTGNGTITINNNVVTITGIDDGMVLDSDIKRAYVGNVAKDGAIEGDYPVLIAGGNTVAFSGGVTSIEIVPRWWSL